LVSPASGSKDLIEEDERKNANEIARFFSRNVAFQDEPSLSPTGTS
jgi:hypothetical protein